MKREEIMKNTRGTNRMPAWIASAIFLLACITGSAYAAQQTESAARNMLTPEQVRSDISLAKEAYERVHPGYTRYTDIQELDAAWQAIVADAQSRGGLSVGDLYLRIQQALTLIRCDHTKANLPKSLLKERDVNPVYLPFRWLWLDGRAFVTVAGAATGLAVNDELLAVDGRPIEAMVEEVLPYIPYDGYTRWSRLAGVAESLEFKGGAIDHFGALLWKVQPRAELTIKTVQGEVQTRQVQRINHRQWTALAGENASKRNFKDALQFERIGENAAYIRIDTFVNYRQPVDPEDIYDPVFEAIQQEQRDLLIIDLRQNGGGSNDAAYGLLANLITEPTQASLDMRARTLDFDGIRQHLWTWDKRALDPYRIAFSKNNDGSYSLRSWLTDDLDTIKPARYAFGGKIIALTSHANSSGSTNLLAVIQSTGRATLVGEKTGGSAEGPTAGLLFTLTLPESNITTRIPYFQSRNNVTGFEHGMGVIPDIAVAMTSEALLAGQDPALEKAQAIIEKHAQLKAEIF
jgi:C-terminal processing protease CtpA/Prc